MKKKQRLRQKTCDPKKREVTTQTRPKADQNYEDYVLLSIYFCLNFFFSGYICNSIEAYASTLKVCKACLRHAPAKPWTLRHTHYGANDFFFPLTTQHILQPPRRMPEECLSKLWLAPDIKLGGWSLSLYFGLLGKRIIK